MPDRKISQLNLTISPNNSDVFAIVNEGETKKITYGTIKDSIIQSHTLPPGLGSTGLGWARYDDGTYTTSSFFTVTTQMGQVVLPNSGSFVVDEHIHSSVDFYNTGSMKIQAENVNDVYVCTLSFKAKTSNANSAYFRIQLDSIGDVPYERVGKDLFFPKGNNVWHEIHEVFQWYANEDFVNDGSQWKIQTFNAETDIADIIYFIQRTQNHGNE